ncbi:MAG: glycoside hydrolase N-terminal domain-containing protein, partial [Ignavibacteriaceae bacterium]
MINSKLRSITVLVVALISFILYAYQATDQKWLISPPEHGFVSLMPASKWEESMITGNGTTGALIWGKPQNEIIILSHERLFLPEYPPTEAPNLGKHLETIRELVLKGEGRKAAELAVQLGVEAGIEDLIWTDPLVPACQIEIESLSRDSIVNYARSVNYETGEALTTWKTEEGIFHRKIFTSRPDDISVLKIFSPHNIKQNVKIRLAQLPVSESETNGDLEDEFSSIELIEEVKSTVNDDGTLTYITLFQKKWEGSLKGYIVEAKVIAKNGEMSSNDGWLFVNDTDEILVLSKIKLSYDLPVNTETNIDKYAASSYEALLEKHASIHGEMFNRFSFKLGSNEEKHVTSEDLLNSSSFGKLNNDLLVQIMEAARYTLISSTGELPPTLQGIWG